jgi:hypothetical protein
MSAAPKVTSKDPNINGKMPNCAGSEIGYQFLPKIKLPKLTVLNTLKPSFSKNRNIRITKNMEARPQIKINFSMMNSLNFLI